MNNKVLNFPAFWENEVLLNALSLLFYLFIYKLVISWRDVRTHVIEPNYGFFSMNHLAVVCVPPGDTNWLG